MSISSFAQRPIIYKQAAGSLTLSAGDSSSVIVTIWNSTEFQKNRIHWEGQWGLHVKAEQVTGSTIGAFNIAYKRVDWNYATEDMDTVNVITSWTPSASGSFKMADVHQNMPTYGLAVVATRTGGDGTVKLTFTSTLIKWDE